MTNRLIKTDDYKAFVQDINQQVQSVQIKAAIKPYCSFIGT